MKIKFLPGLVLLLCSLYAYPQNIDEFFEAHKSAPLQKIYLHTDRQFYFLNDTLWFAAYLVNGVNQVPVPGNSNLYVELINSDGEVKQSGIFTMFDGFAQGFLHIDWNNMEDGSYLLRSYNDYLRNFGEDCFFYKNLKISKSTNNVESVGEPEPGVAEMGIDLYPEGGFLLAGEVNQVAFMINGLADETKKVSGTILDENGREITRFSTIYKGMGKLFFVPELNTAYKVKLDEFPDREWELPKIHAEGAKIIATLIDSAYVNFSIIHSKTNENQNFHLAVMHRGQGLLFINIDAANLDKMIRLTNNYFGEGINRVILLNQFLEPVSERLIFRNNLESTDLKLALNKSTFSTREEVVLHMYTPEKLAAKENAGLSVTVVNTNALNAKGLTQNIKSYLLIDSELKGQVPDPLDFFTDSEKVPARLKQDLLMLTQGWSNYIWNELENNKAEIDSLGFGLQFRGKLTESKKQKAIPDSEVFLRFNTKTQSSLLFTFTDDLGNFKFPKVFFTDTAYYQIQGNDAKGKLNATAKLEPLIDSPAINPMALKSANKFQDIPMSLYRLNFQNEQALNEFYPDKDSRVLEEIKVTGKENSSDDGHYRIYSIPSISLKVTKQDLSYRSIFDYLQGRASGVQVINGRIIIHGFSSMGGAGVDIANDPLFLLDGVAIDKSAALSISMSAIDKIEVLKSNEAAMFGARGSTGVISILTKSNEYPSLGMKGFPADVYDIIIGFSPYREFYSPRYNSDNLQSKIPDYRTTLYWKPDVQLIDGQAILSFFTCDNLSDYSIFVEGISSNGRVCLGEAKFVVDSHRGSEE